MRKLRFINEQNRNREKSDNIEASCSKRTELRNGRICILFIDFDESLAEYANQPHTQLHEKAIDFPLESDRVVTLYSNYDITANRTCSIYLGQQFRNNLSHFNWISPQVQLDFMWPLRYPPLLSVGKVVFCDVNHVRQTLPHPLGVLQNLAR